MAVSARGSAFLFAAGVLLGGCTLGSDAPFVTRGDAVPGLIDGQYQRYLLADSAKLRAVPADIRRDCVAPGYVFRLPEGQGRSRSHRIAPSYCPYDGVQRIPAITIARQGDGYRLAEAGKGLSVRFRRLRDGIYLIQSDDPESTTLRYGYALAREAPGGIDLALLLCDYFPALQSIREVTAGNAVEAPDGGAGPASAPAARPTPEPETAGGSGDLLPGQHGDCRAPSLDAVQPQLDAVVDRFAQGRELVWVLLRRVPAG